MAGLRARGAPDTGWPRFLPPAVVLSAALILVVACIGAGTSSATSASDTGTLTFAPAADTFVAAAAPASNNGSAAALEVDNSPVKHTLLKFTVTGVGTRQVTSARLRLHAFDRSPIGGSFFATTRSSWGESSVTWSSAPATRGRPLATLGAVVAGSWYEVDLTSFVRGDGTYSVRVSSTATDGADYDSKERGGGLGPQLVVTTSDGVPGSTVIAGAGDIADGGPGAAQTAALLDTVSPAVVYALGDNAYENGTLAEYQDRYAPTWGRHRAKTRPAPGNHEYNTPGATGYYDYFGARAGERAKGYYSYDLGTWHIVVLNSNCAAIGGCGLGSPQHDWLLADLAGVGTSCIAAYWHHPRFSSGNYGNDATFEPFWQALYDAGADIVLSGHDHNYQRYAPLTPQGLVDEVRGVREFVVGTGGRSSLNAVARPGPSTRMAASDDVYGILKLTLGAASYTWRFIPVSGSSYGDSGTDTCVRTPTDTARPSTPAGPTASPPRRQPSP